MRNVIRIRTANDLPTAATELYAELGKRPQHGIDTNGNTTSTTWVLLIGVRNATGEIVLEAEIDCHDFEPQLYGKDFT